MDTKKARLLEILKEKSFQKKHVVLASGRESNFYIDCRQTALHPEGAKLIGDLFFRKISEIENKLNLKGKAVGGMTMGADPLATATSLASFDAEDPRPAYLVRKEAKDHGAGNQVEGTSNFNKGDHVILLEDVVTTGGSSLKAAEALEREGYKIAFILALVDRNEGGKENILAKGYKHFSLFNKSDFMGEE